MGLHFIFGSPGTGKTTRCLQEIETYLRGGEERRAFLIVPDQSTYTAEVRMARQMKEQGFTRITVCGFSRLARHVCKEAGFSQETALSPLGEQIIVRRLLESHEKRLHVLSGQSSRPHFSETMSLFFHRLETYCLSADDLQAASEAEGDTPLGRKLDDLAFLYKAYGNFLAERFSYGSLFDLFFYAVPLSKCLHGSHIWIDGFYNMSPQKIRIVSALIRRADSVTVTVPCGHPEEAPTNPNEAEPLRFFTSLARETSRFDSVTLTTPYRFQDCRVRALATDFFSLSPRRLPLSPSPVSPSAGVHILSASDKQGETDFLARRIATLVREEGLRYRNILVLLRTLDPYAACLERSFRQYHIPAFIDNPRLMNHHPLVILLGAMLRFLDGESRSAHGGYTRKILLRLLKTDLLSVLTGEETDKLDNYVLRYGIRYGAWHREWSYRDYENPDQDKGPLTDEERQTMRDANTWRTKVLSFLEPLSKSWAAAHTVREKIALLYKTLVAAGVPHRLAQWDEEEFALTRTHPHRQVWKKITNLFDEAALAAGNDVWERREWLTVMEDGLSALTFSLIPPTLDHVTVTSVNRGFTEESDVVFILNASEGEFPKRTEEEPLFSETEKQRLSDVHHVDIGARLLQNIREEHFFTQLALTRASRAIYLIYPLLSESGKEQTPSFLLTRLQQMGYAPPTEEIRLPSPTEDHREWFVSMAQALSLLPGVLREGLPADTSNWTALKDCALADEKGRLILERQLRSLTEKNKAEPLPPALAAKLFKPNGRFFGSVTRFEQYRQCPYRYFLRYGLSAQERPEAAPNISDFGNYLHAGLHRFGLALNSSRKQWRDATDEDISHLSETISDLIAPRIKGSSLLADGASRYTHRLLNDTFRRTLERLRAWSRQSDFDTTALEKEFFTRIDAGGGDSFTLNGKIDRVDTNRNAFAVYDYKSGSPDLTLQEIVTGCRLQLITYLLSVVKEQGADGLLPAAMMYIYLSGDVASIPAVPPGGTPPDKENSYGCGYFLADASLLKQIDRLVGTDKSYIPISFKKDGTFRSASPALRFEEMEALLREAEKQLVRLYRRICDGRIDIRPLRMKNRLACTYCPYLAVCQFDETIPGNRFDYVPPKSDSLVKEELLQTKERES